MTRNNRAEIASVAVWWAALTVLLWGAGRLLDQPASLAACAASAALLVACGETGDWLRRRRRAWLAVRNNRDR
ncbi:hypothetical protein [Streptomyces sp. NPDC048340]|uniref:hypothetical protein n=1 Tax=Streptomyces sp. NPDC048340 TaxID=3365537 RepID=UPI003717C4E1